MSQIKGIEQGRAAFAYGRVKAVKVSSDKTILINEKTYKIENYDSYVKKVPMMIKTNGLGATFAFLKSRGGQKKGEDTKNEDLNAYDLIYFQTYQWLKMDNKLELFDANKDEDLIEVIISQNSKEYRYLTLEVLSLFGWLKRFTEGIFEKEEKPNPLNEE